MPKPRKAGLSQDQVKEMLAAYESKQATAIELQSMYGVTRSQFYRVVHDHGIPLQYPQIANRKNGTKVPDLTQVEQHDLEEELANEPILHTSQVQVVVDKENMVQSARPIKRPNVSTWEIAYTGTVLVEAEDIETAIYEARKLGVVKRIYSAKVKR